MAAVVNLAVDRVRAAYRARSRRAAELEDDLRVARLLLHLAPFSGHLGIRGCPEVLVTPPVGIPAQRRASDVERTQPIPGRRR